MHSGEAGAWKVKSIPPVKADPSTRPAARIIAAAMRMKIGIRRMDRFGGY